MRTRAVQDEVPLKRHDVPVGTNRAEQRGAASLSPPLFVVAYLVLLKPYLLPYPPSSAEV